jgi:hypothetical protein
MGTQAKTSVIKLSFIAVVGIIVTAAITAGLTYSAGRPQVTSLKTDKGQLQVSVLTLQNEVAELDETLGNYRQRVTDSLGDKLLITQTDLQELPKTIADARADGFVLIDRVDSKGKVTEAMCFNHDAVLHYAKLNPTMTGGVEWHGAPYLLLYNVDSEKLAGMVLESTSAQPSPPWEYHAGGHPGMGFPHASLHIWFTAPGV